MRACIALSFGYFLLSLTSCEAQFPRKCVDDFSITNRQCCPIGFDGTMCNEASGKGSCQPVNVAATNLTKNETRLYFLDERAGWPYAFYDRACFCRNNFDGVDCSRCRPGFQGKQCAERSSLLIRRNLTSLTPSELQVFVDILDRSKRTKCENYVILTTSFDRILLGDTPQFRNVSVYDLFVWMHAHISKDNLVFDDPIVFRHLQTNDLELKTRLEITEDLTIRNTSYNVETDVDYAHEGSAFLPWHRYFMLKWEAEIREFVANDSGFVLPYWDWTNKEDCDVCVDSIMGGINSENRTLISPESPFSQWEVICTRGNEYMFNRQLCTGESEGPLIRNPGNYDPSKTDGLPRAQEVENVLILGDMYDTPNFDTSANQSYRNLLEGFARTDNGVADPNHSYMHNAVHLFMNGTMSSVGSSANDPIFLIHHSFVDSLFELWIRKREKAGKSAEFSYTSEPRLGHRPQDYMVPFFPLVQNRRGFVGSVELGYTYDYIEETERSSALEGNDDESSAQGADNMNSLSRVKVMADIANLTSQLTINRTTAVVDSGVGGVFVRNRLDTATASGANDMSDSNGVVEDSEINEKTIMNVNTGIHGTFDLVELSLGQTAALTALTEKSRKRDKLHQKVKDHASHHGALRPRNHPSRFGEGGFSLHGNKKKVILAPQTLSDPASDVETGNRALLVEEPSAVGGWWRKVRKFFDMVVRVFENMSVKETFLLLLFCFLLALTFSSCYYGCGRRSRRAKQKRSRAICCCGNRGIDEESVTLLEKREDGLLKSKVVKGATYM